MLAAGLWNTVSVGVESVPRCSSPHAIGHAFWFVWAALGFVALGEIISRYRAKTKEELPIAFTLPWLLVNCFGLYVFPTSGFSSACFNALFLVHKSFGRLH